MSLSIRSLVLAVVLFTTVNLSAGFAFADIPAGEPAVKEVTTPSYDFAYVDNIVAALISAGAKNVAPADESYELYQPGDVIIQTSGPEETPKFTVLAIRKGAGWSWSKPLDDAIARYVWPLLHGNAGCKAGYPLANLVCKRTVDLEGSFCTATYQCLKAN